MGWLKENKKKIITVFAAGLMVVFIIPPAVSHFSGRQDVVAGHIGKTEVTSTTISNAHDEWNWLQGRIFVLGMYAGQPQLRPVAQMLPPEAYNAIDQHREMYYLLQYEARRMEVTVSVDRLESLLNQRIYVLDNQRQRVPYDQLRDPDFKAAVKAVVSDFLLVVDAANRAANVLKVSRPMRRQAMATQWQELTLNMVTFKAGELAKKAPKPTQQQLEAMFDRYANTPAGAYSKENPLGFGYRYPDRIKLQYIQLDWGDLQKSVRESRSDYEWKVEAYKQYQAHPEDYKVPASEPTTAPATRSADAASRPAASQPAEAVQPFDQVFGEIRDHLIDAGARSLQQKIRNDLESRLQNDYEAYAESGATTGPSTQPRADSSLGVPYASVEYLHKLADLIKSQYGVRLAVIDLDKYLDATALGKLSGVGDSRTAGHDDGTSLSALGGTDFSQYALSDAAPLLPDHGKSNPAALRLYQLSLPLANTQGDTFYFRLTAAQPAHRPDDLSEVRDQVVKDVQLQEAYKQANQQAETLLAAAKQEGLEAAAKKAGETVKKVGPISSQPGMPVEGLDLSAVAHGQLVQGSFKLLSERATTHQPHPMALIELPAAGDVVVAQLQEVTPQWTQETQPLYEQATEAQVAQEIRQPLLEEWFNYDRLIQRVHYVAVPQS